MNLCGAAAMKRMMLSPSDQRNIEGKLHPSLTGNQDIRIVLG